MNKQLLYNRIMEKLSYIVKNAIIENDGDIELKNVTETVQLQIAYAEKLLWFFLEYFKNLKTFYSEEPKWKMNFSEDFVKMFEETYKTALPDILKYGQAVKKYCKEHNIHLDEQQYGILNKLDENGIYVQRLDNYKNLIQNIDVYLNLSKIIKNGLHHLKQDEIIEKTIFNKLIGEYTENFTKIYNHLKQFSDILDDYKKLRMYQ